MSSDYQFVNTAWHDTDALRRAALLSPEYHRRAVTSLIVEAAGSPDGRCCILGAGFCQDLDLRAVTSRFKEVHLVDIDPDALRQGLRRQAMEKSSAIVCHTPYDVTGVHDDLIALSNTSAWTESAVNELLQRVRSSGWSSLGGGFDVVASTCLFSQVIQHVLDTVGPHGEAVYVPIIQALRLRHLELILHACRPSGVGLFITDIVSSDTLPQLPSHAGEQLRQLLDQAVNNQNFFTGLNPQAIRAAIESQPTLRDELESAQVSQPWVWNAGVRYYAVLAVRMVRCRAEKRPQNIPPSGNTPG